MLGYDYLLELFFFAIVFAVFVGDGWEEVFAEEEHLDGEVFEDVGFGFEEDVGEWREAVELGDDGVHHGANDVGVVFLFFEEVGDPEDEQLAVVIVFEAAEGELLVGTHHQFHEGGKVGLGRRERSLADDGEGVEIGEGLRENVDARVVGFELGLKNFAAFNEVVVPAVLAEGFDDGVELDGRCDHRVRRKPKPSGLS